MPKQSKLEMPFRCAGKPSFWNAKTHGVSSSMIAKWLECREQFYKMYCLGWRSRNVPDAPLFGNILHDVLMRAYGHPKPPKIERIHRYCEDYKVKWRERVKNPTSAQVSQIDYLIVLARVTLQYYFARWKGDFPGCKYPQKTKQVKPHKWIGREQYFKTLLPLSDGVVIPVWGQRDGVFLADSPRPYFMDTKCLSMIVHNDLIDTLPYAAQFGLYGWAYRAEHGVCPSGMIENIIRRSQAAKAKRESLVEYEEALHKEYQSKPFDHFFFRIQIDWDNSDLDEFQNNFLMPVVLDMYNWSIGKAPHYWNPNNLLTKYGRCELFQLMVKGDKSNYYRLDNPLDYHV